MLTVNFYRQSLILKKAFHKGLSQTESIGTSLKSMRSLLTELDSQVLKKLVECDGLSCDLLTFEWWFVGLGRVNSVRCRLLLLESL